MTDPSDNQFLESLVFLSGVSPTIWLNNSQEVKTLLKDFSAKAIDIGLDLTGLEDHYDVKDQAQFLELFNNIDVFMNNQNGDTFATLVDNYRTFFNIDETPSIQNVPNVEGNTIYLDTQKSSFELFSNFGLLPVAKNVYRRVNNARDVEAVYNLMYDNITRNPLIMPIEFYQDFAMTNEGIINRSKVNDPANRAEIVQRMKEFVRGQIHEIDSQGQVRDTDMLEKMYLYSTFFNTELNNVEEIPAIETEAYLVEEDFSNVEYLTGDFIADFNKQYLREKQKNSALFQNFFSNFEVTNKGIKIINTDPLSMARIEIELENRPDLKKHLLLQKNSQISEQLEDENFLLEDETFLRNYYANFPRAVKKFDKDYSVIENDTLIAKTPDNFIRTDQGLFEMVDSYGDYSVFKRIQENNSNYKAYSKEFTKPVNEIDLSGYGFSENNTDSSKSVNNLYSAEQEANIDNLIDNCS